MTDYNTLRAKYRAMTDAEAIANCDSILAAHDARKGTLAYRACIWAERLFNRLTRL